MKLGSLFDGIGGFPLAGLKHGIEPVWASEIEPFPIKVTKERFPGMKHLGSVCDINGAEVEPVDIITFGSPCQDLSVAGKRAGMDGDRSSLFFEAVRIIREMREATNGLYPRFAIWENVPGAFSSNQGHDFRAVLEALAEAEVPMPTTGKWATAGMVRGEGRSLAWRVLDAQHWGVPQRRRRIFLVADFGGQAAPEILFESEGMCRDIAEGRTAWQEVAPATEDGVGASGPVALPFDTTQVTSPKNWSSPEYGDPCHPLCATAHVPSVVLAVDTYNTTISDTAFSTIATNVGSPTAAGPKVMTQDGTDIARTLTARRDSSPCADRGPTVVMAFSAGQSAKAGSIGAAVGLTPTLRSGASGTNQVPTLLAFGPGGNNEVTHALRSQPSMADKPDSTTYVVNKEKYCVRRLTPTECERLQGYPDGWTDIPGASDSKRYKALGNSVAVPCVEFVLGNIAKVMSL